MPILFYENERATTLHMALEKGAFESVALLTGPEGGLEEKEVAQAMEAGFQVCTLGKRILRCETAPLCALSAVMYASGECYRKVPPEGGIFLCPVGDCLQF